MSMSFFSLSAFSRLWRSSSSAAAMACGGGRTRAYRRCGGSGLRAAHGGPVRASGTRAVAPGEQHEEKERERERASLRAGALLSLRWFWSNMCAQSPKKLGKMHHRSHMQGWPWHILVSGKLLASEATPWPHTARSFGREGGQRVCNAFPQYETGELYGKTTDSDHHRSSALPARPEAALSGRRGVGAPANLTAARAG